MLYADVKSLKLVRLTGKLVSRMASVVEFAGMSDRGGPADGIYHRVTAEYLTWMSQIIEKALKRPVGKFDVKKVGRAILFFYEVCGAFEGQCAKAEAAATTTGAES